MEPHTVLTSTNTFCNKGIIPSVCLSCCIRHTCWVKLTAFHLVTQVQEVLSTKSVHVWLFVMDKFTGRLSWFHRMNYIWLSGQTILLAPMCFLF